MSGNISDNIALQLEELEALESIFGDQWKRCETQDDTYNIKISKEVELWITLNEFYPSEKPPHYDLWAPSLSREQKEIIDKEFKDIYETNKGFSIIFQWIEKLKEISDMESESPTIGNFNENHKEVNPIEDQPMSMSEPLKQAGNLEIVHGVPLTDRKSTFQAHACRITHKSQVKQFQEQLLENKKVAQATHNILAYRLIDKSKNIVIQDCDDDGETQAGGRLLHLLEMLQVMDVALIVTRWYGGIHLGPDRFKHINNSGRQVLLEAGFIDR